MNKGLLLSFAVVLVFTHSIFAKWKHVEGKIMTRWAQEVDPEKPWPEYPRPMMVRDNWVNLNGLWDYAIAAKDTKQPQEWDGQILVPYPIESALSGVGKTVGTDHCLWYRKTLSTPTIKDGRVLLHFGAVDWQSTVWVNGKKVGIHKGGHNPFSYDITDALKSTGPQEIVIRVWDPTDADNSPQPRGKQVIDPGGIFYTSVTGIWQTVWLETVPKAYIESIKITPDIDTNRVSVEVSTQGIDPETHLAEKFSLVATASESNNVVKEVSGTCFSGPLMLEIPSARLWSPDDPFLYDLKVQLRQEGGTRDEVSSYFGMRKSSLEKDDKGVNRLFLNNKPLFQFGPLDQGWWPDGLYTPATDDALRYDVEMTKALGFNMLRKHVKSEPQRFYYWCDKLGILVWQDMPSALYERDQYKPEQLKGIDKQWGLEWKAIIDALYSHPSIVMWVPFNEEWGQHDTERITAWTKQYDPSRLVNNASGWTDKGVGDVHDIHSYPGPEIAPLEENRAVVLGEFGGLGLPVPGHLWQERDNWGYRSYEDQAAFENSYINLMTKLFPLVKQGLAAAVYTQTSDVEVEVNGLMTYDRQVVKLDPKKVALTNRGYLPPVFASEIAQFVDSMDVELIAQNNAQIRYTLDGSEPTKESTLYQKPIHVNKMTTVKARCYWPDDMKSAVAERTFKPAVPLKAVDVKIQENGLRYEYFEGRWEQLPDFSQLTAVRKGITEQINLDSAEGNEELYALRLTGFIQAPKTGAYIVSVASDDGSRVFIHGKEVITNDGIHGVPEKSAVLVLEAGRHPIEILYFQGFGGQGLNAFWQNQDIGKEEIPASALGH